MYQRVYAKISSATISSQDDGSAKVSVKSYLQNGSESWGWAASKKVYIGGTCVRSDGKTSSGTKGGTFNSDTDSKTFSKTHNNQSITVKVTTSVEDGTSHSSSKTVTIGPKASWTITLNNQNILSYVQKWYNEAITLPTLSSDNLTFGGWNTNSSGTGTNYSGGSSYNGNAEATLYAIWDCVVTFNPGSGATGDSYTQTAKKGSTINLTSFKNFTRTGYHFTGWLGSDGKTYTNEQVVTLDSNLTLTAQWALDGYNLSYTIRKQGTTTVMDSGVYNQANNTSVPWNFKNINGYRLYYNNTRFDGVTLTSNETREFEARPISCTINGSSTIYPNLTYNTTFTKDYGTVATGYHRIGYRINGTEYLMSSIIGVSLEQLGIIINLPNYSTTSVNITLEVLTEPNTYTITWKNNLTGDDLITYSNTYKYGENVFITNNDYEAFSRIGYSIQWHINSSTGTIVSPTLTTDGYNFGTCEGNTVYIAVYVAGKNTVYFDNAKYTNISSNETWTIPISDPVKPGFIFNSWKTPNTDGTYKYGQIYDLHENTQFTSQWTVGTDIKFDSNNVVARDSSNPENLNISFVVDRGLLPGYSEPVDTTTTRYRYIVVLNLRCEEDSDKDNTYTLDGVSENFNFTTKFKPASITEYSTDKTYHLSFTATITGQKSIKSGSTWGQWTDVETIQTITQTYTILAADQILDIKLEDDGTKKINFYKETYMYNCGLNLLSESSDKTQDALTMRISLDENGNLVFGW